MSAYDEEARMAAEEAEKVWTSCKAQIQVVLNKLGLPPEDENFKDTAQRFLRYLQHYTQTYNPKDDLEVTFPASRVANLVHDRAMVVQVGIPYRAVCAHHLLPVLGTAHIGYIPTNRVVGLSKLARLVYGLSHRTPSLQEDVCDQITQALMQYLKPVGAMCVIKAEHGCMAARGIEEASGCIETITSSVKGVFQKDSITRKEFYELVKLRS